MGSRFKSLAENTAIFAISQFASKILVVVMLPFYTYYMTTEEYGDADLVFSTINLFLPLITMQLSSAVLRFAIDSSARAKTYFANGSFLIGIGLVLFLLVCPLLKVFNVFDGYLLFFALLFILESIYTFVSHYARGVNRIRLVGIVGTVNTLIVVLCNVYFIAVLRLGIKGYLTSYIVSFTICNILYFWFLRKDISFSRKYANKNCMKEMTKYSIPLVPNSVSWWGVNSANKYVIYGFLTSGTLGLYSVALRIPSVINTVQSIISEALVLSILNEYNEKEKDIKYFSLLYKVYGLITAFMVFATVSFSKVISMLLFANEFFAAWYYVPLLCIPTIWGALSGYLGTFYAAEKKNGGMFFSTLVGCVFTVVFSLLTVKSIGVMGIIIGNLLSYFIIWVYRWIDVKKYVSLEVNLLGDLATWAALIILAIVVMFAKTAIIIVVTSILVFVLLMLINHKTIVQIIKTLLERIKNKRFKLRSK